MEADLNVTLQSTVSKGQSLSRLNDWRILPHVTRKKSVVSPEDRVNYRKMTRSIYFKFFYETYMGELFIIRSSRCIQKILYGEILFHKFYFYFIHHDNVTGFLIYVKRAF